MTFSGGGWFVPVLILLLTGAAVVLAITGGVGGRDHDRGGQASRRWWLPALLGVLAMLLLIGLLVFGTGRSGGGWWGPMGAPMGGHMGGTRSQDAGQGEAPDAFVEAEELTVEVTEMAFEPATLEVAARAGRRVRVQDGTLSEQIVGVR